MKDGRLLKLQIPCRLFCTGGQEEKEKAGGDDDLGKPYFSQDRRALKFKITLKYNECTDQIFIAKKNRGDILTFPTTSVVKADQLLCIQPATTGTQSGKDSCGRQ